MNFAFFGFLTSPKKKGGKDFFSYEREKEKQGKRQKESLTERFERQGHWPLYCYGRGFDRAGVKINTIKKKQKN